MSTILTTAEGRIVWGEDAPFSMHLLTDHQKRPKIDKKTGQQAQGVELGFAIPKAQFGPVWEVMAQEAQAGFPGQEYLDRATGGFKTFNDKNGFAWKVKDGDVDPQGVDDQGNPKKYPDHYRGHYILTLATRYPVPAFRVADVMGEKKFVQITDITEIKKGFKGQVQIEITGNGDVGDTAGLYINPKQFLLTDASENLILAGAGGGNPNAAFGDAGQYAAAMPGQAQGMPGQAQGMPGQAQGMPGQAQGMPGQAQGMPGQAQGMPGQAQGMPGQAAGNPAMSAGAGTQGNAGYVPDPNFANPPTYPGQ